MKKWFYKNKKNLSQIENVDVWLLFVSCTKEILMVYWIEKMGCPELQLSRIYDELESEVPIKFQIIQLYSVLLV